LATGAPTLADAVGVIDCELIETIERYDVVIILGRVVATSSNPAAVPLVHFRGGYLP
jgi:flavin reductase (DIM6/NTAB) family NADH-FMN oxidoreductase RutF